MKLPAMAVVERTTADVKNIPQTATAKDLYTFFESVIGKDSVFACQIFAEHKNWKSRGYGKVQFETLDAKTKALSLANECKLMFKGYYLKLSHSSVDLIARPVEPKLRLENGVLHTGFMVDSQTLSVLESWKSVSIWVMPENRSIHFLLNHGGECYKLEVQFGDILESWECSMVNPDTNGVLLQLKYAPKIFRKISGPNVASKFSADRYLFCKEDLNFVWARTTDFSSHYSFGYSSSLCWEIDHEFSGLDLFSCLPLYKNDLVVELEQGPHLSAESELVPLVKCNYNGKLTYEILFQLNSLVHTQKLSLGAINSDLIEVLSKLDPDIALLILQKMHNLESKCYEPASFVNAHLNISCKNNNSISSLSYKRLASDNLMTCHRVLVTPSKIYCLGPELEKSNYIVKNFASYASDFLRVTFVEEDWSKLHTSAIVTAKERAVFPKRVKTDIYQRVLSVLQNGIVIGDKKFLFLAFSASQLRSSSVWMFASNKDVTTEHIRDWMGCFKKIRSVSKCAARMGQLFSSSIQTFEVQPQEVQLIPDIEVTHDGVEYCFSDGIGKISHAFAKQVATKCNLTHTPSAFQIRYGGYKGVIAVDRHSFRKLSLRSSMLKFESKNRMLNVAKWSKAMPCYLNREIITLLSTLGVRDQVFLDMQNDQMNELGKMLTDREAALRVLDSMGLKESKSIIVKMLRAGYKPDMDPYILMMLQSYHESQLSDLRSRCRIFVPKGRVLIGCLDETKILEYGQVYVQITMTKRELQCKEQIFIQKDDNTCILKGKVVVTKNPCLHPGDVRVLEAVYEVALEENGWVDCIIFPQKGKRPHPNECSGGDLDGDLYFISWDENLFPSKTVEPMEYIARRPRILDHDVSLEEIQQFFVDYMVSDTLGTISNAHLVHADREQEKALSEKCLQLATLHSMAVDFAKTGASAEMPQFLKPREFPDFMERWNKPMYTSQGALGKLYRACIAASGFTGQSRNVFSAKAVEDAYDHNLVIDGYEDFLEMAKNHKKMYLEKISNLLRYYEAQTEAELLTGNLHNKSIYLQHDNRRYIDLRDRILESMKSLRREARGWFEHSSNEADKQQKLASAWYYVTYHPEYCKHSANCLNFPWIVGDILLAIKSSSNKEKISD